ncbi:hypothetical protein Hypma_005526 [Hypsizygus marmoreus]|uniref:Uncharacterized protein n=1 Tax=Hypsizygus marmoreus TaxID=39966 RepID=A0A369JXZ8_HYPMA|nr:hypothetical protein Hypma_005526 [Hypsizygus marmoreus]
MPAAYERGDRVVFIYEHTDPMQTTARIDETGTVTAVSLSKTGGVGTRYTIQLDSTKGIVRGVPESKLDTVDE